MLEQRLGPILRQTINQITVGGIICFFICRLALKQKVEVWLTSKGPVVTGMVADLTEHSTKIGLIIRLTPIPVGMQHAALAVSPIPLKD